MHSLLSRLSGEPGRQHAGRRALDGLQPPDRLLLARRYTERPSYGHDGVVVSIRSDLRWCSDGFEFTVLKWRGRAWCLHPSRRDVLTLLRPALDGLDEPVGGRLELLQVGI